MILSAAAMCLAQNIFFEARNEDIMGQIMVAEVTLNRVADKRYPNDICGVVWQKKQFSWTHDGKSDNPDTMSYLDRQKWKEIKTLTMEIMNEEINLPRSGATHYHATYVAPSWANSLTKVGKVGKHIFYTWN